MRRPRHVILLLALEALSRSLVLCSETGTAAGRAAVSEELPTRTAGVAVGGGSNPSSQDRGGDDGRQRWHDAASWVEARSPTAPGREPVTMVPTAASTASHKDEVGVGVGAEDQSDGGGFGGGAGGDEGGGAARGRHFGGRRPRQSETATFFNSLDENSDGVLAEDEIREFVGYVGGSTLDDNSEISGGVSSVMGRLDTDSEEGIGLKELSSWINRLGSMLTVEEAAEWVTHAVQLPHEVAEAFRSNSISAYDFPELVRDNGAGLDDLGIQSKFWKRIVKAIEIRLLGLGDEPPRPVLHPPSYLGAGKVRVEWSAGGLAAGVERDHDNQDEPSSSAPLPPPSSPSPSSSPGHGVVVPRAPLSASAVDDDGEAVESAPAGPEGEGEGGQRGLGAIAAEDQQDQAEDAAAPDRGQPAASPRAATFPIHKYVLQRSCLHHYSHAAAPPAGTTAEGGGGGSGGGGWVTVHEADDVGFASSSTSFVFVDSGLAPGKTHVYRVRAWNLIGHSEALTAHVITTPAVPSLWKKPWRVLSPWWRTGNSSSASSSSAAPQGSAASQTGGDAAPGFLRSTTGDGAVVVAGGGSGGGGGGGGGDGSGGGIGFANEELGAESEGQGGGGWGWREGFGAAWSVLCWVGWGVAGLGKVLNAVLVLATLQTNLTRLRAAYGHGGTGTALRRNWAASLVWKVNHVLTRNRVISGAIGALNERLERAIGLPPLPPSAGGPGLRRQRSARMLRGSGGGGGGGSSGVEEDRPHWDRSWSSSSRPGSREYYYSGEEEEEEAEADGLVRIDEDYSGLGVGVGGSGGGGRVRGREAHYYHTHRGYPKVTPSRAFLGRQRSSPSTPRLRRQQSFREYPQQQQQQQAVGHDARNSLSLSRSSHRMYRGGRGEREKGQWSPVEAGAQGGAEPSPVLSRYATRSTDGATDARDNHNLDRRAGRGGGGRHSHEWYHSRSSSRSSRSEHRRLRSDATWEEKEDAGGVDLVRRPSNASASSASSPPYPSARNPYLDEPSAGRSGDRRRRGSVVAGAGGPEETHHGRRRGWFGWGKATATADDAGAAAAVGTGAGARAEIVMHTRDESGRRGSFGLSEEYLDDIVGDAEDDEDVLSDGRLSDGYSFAGVGGGDAHWRKSERDADAGGVGMRPTLERSGSSLDFRRAMPHFRKSSVGRLALGLKKGEASGREGWRKEYRAAEECFHCRRPFKTVTRQRHHCGRCHRVFCSKHGYASHVQGLVCSIPSGCICDVCLRSVVDGGSGNINALGGDDADPDAYEAPQPRKRLFKAKVRALKAESEAGATASIGSAQSVRSEASEGGGKRGRRFSWRGPASFGQLRRRRRAPSGQSEGENKEEEAFSEAIMRGTAAAHRSNNTAETISAVGARPTTPLGSRTPSRVASGRAVVAATASPSADGSSPATVREFRVVAAGDAADVAAGGAEEVLIGDRRARRGGEGWAGVFGGARRRITE